MEYNLKIYHEALAEITKVFVADIGVLVLQFSMCPF